jgi:hypothetical protein
MSPKPITENTLFYGENLPMPRDYIADVSIDLVYLDPPLNSDRTNNVLFNDEMGVESEVQAAAVAAPAVLFSRLGGAVWTGGNPNEARHGFDPLDLVRC